MTTPADPETWTLIEAVAERMRAVKITDGYYTDAGLDVITETIGHKDEPSAPQSTVFMDGAISITQETRKWTDVEVPIVVQIRIPLSAERAQKMAHGAAADIRKALNPSSGQISPDEFKAVIESIDIVPRPFGAAVIVVQAVLRASLRIYKPA